MLEKGVVNGFSKFSGLPVVKFSWLLRKLGDTRAPNHSIGSADADAGNSSALHVIKNIQRIKYPEFFCQFF